MLPILGAHNVANQGLSLDAMALLNKGLRFISTPSRLQLPQLLTGLDRFERSVRLRCQFGGGAIPKFRVPNPGFEPKTAPASVEDFLDAVRSGALARYDTLQQQRQQQHKRVPAHNLRPAERQALQDLRQQHDLIIKPADKNLGLVIMAASDYRTCVLQHVSDTRVYEDVTDSIDQQRLKACRRLVTLVNQYEGPLGMDVCKYALQGLQKCMQQPAHLYCLPKLHKMQCMKPPIVGRPIAACHSWITTNISKVVGEMLNSVLHEHPTILLDRTDLVSLVESAQVTESTWLVTFDVESLYPSIDQAQCAEACAEAVDGSTMRKVMVHDFVLFVLQNNIVQVEGRYYRQTSGGAMGNNLLPPAAQLYMALKWEKRIKEELGEGFPALFKRFLDDGFVLFEGSREALQRFIQVMQNALPNINITHTCSKSQVDFLDLVVYKVRCAATGAYRLKVRTHQKALNRYLYIPYSSFHHKGVFKSFVHAELIRYVITNTEQCWYDNMVAKFSHRLLQRGYPQQWISAQAAAVSFSDRDKYLQRSTHAPSSSAASALIVPYLNSVPELGLQQLLHDMYTDHPAAHAHMAKPFVCFTKGSNLGAKLVRAGA
mgnify:FL=1